MLSLAIILTLLLRRNPEKGGQSVLFLSQGVIMGVITIASTILEISEVVNLPNIVPTWLSVVGAIVLLILLPGIVIYFAICFLLGFSRGDFNLAILVVSLILNGFIWYLYGYAIHYAIKKMSLKKAKEKFFKAETGELGRK
jgi:hypothetical protein